jgi:hypothetical protein
LRGLATTIALAALATAAGCSLRSSGPHTASLPLPPVCHTSGYPAPDPHRPRYALHLRMTPSTHTVTGELSVAFTPDVGTDRLLFRLWANGPALRREGARLAVSRIVVDGHRRQLRLPDPTTLVVPAALAAGHTVTAQLRFRLTLPQRAKDRISQDGDSIRLGSFFPVLPWVPGRGWATEPPAHVPSETSTTPVADFDVHIAAPPGLGVLASGAEVAPGHWVARAVRDFAVAAGDFRTVRRRIAAPGPVDLTVAVARGVAVDPQQAADLAQRSLQHLAALYGRYPWRTFTLAYGPDLEAEGIEYPTLVFEGPGQLQLITPHEIAHQWFYSLVGDDQAADPWLDEGLASWAGGEAGSELQVFQTVPIPADAGGHLGAPMTYWDRHPHDYFAGVYAQGVQALSSLGPVPRVACALRRYVAHNAYGIANDADALAAFSSVFPDARTHFAGYGVR